MNYNALTLYVYSSGLTQLIDPLNELQRAEQIIFDTFYPGGLFGQFSCFIPRDPDAGWPFKAGQRLVARNGLSIVYEGALISPGYSAQSERGGGWVTAAGRVGRRWGWANLHHAEGHRLGCQRALPRALLGPHRADDQARDDGL